MSDQIAHLHPKLQEIVLSECQIRGIVSLPNRILQDLENENQVSALLFTLRHESWLHVHGETVAKLFIKSKSFLGFSRFMV
jgi:hypothetical protein